jgi:hypothetical protein
MQLLAHRKVSDYDAWRRVFYDDAEARGNAGLTLLQLWREADDPGRVWMLYEVSERGMAEEYLEGLGQLHAEEGGATQAGHHFLRTA